MILDELYKLLNYISEREDVFINKEVLEYIDSKKERISSYDVDLIERYKDKLGDNILKILNVDMIKKVKDLYQEVIMKEDMSKKDKKFVGLLIGMYILLVVKICHIIYLSDYKYNDSRYKDYYIDKQSYIKYIEIIVRYLNYDLGVIIDMDIDKSYVKYLEVILSRLSLEK